MNEQFSVITVRRSQIASVSERQLFKTGFGKPTEPYTKRIVHLKEAIDVPGGKTYRLDAESEIAWFLKADRKTLIEC